MTYDLEPKINPSEYICRPTE